MARIAVIGAGLGAMAASARLATAGHSVTVYERTETYGGGVRRYERDGFRFDTGPGILHLPAVYRDLFVKTGRERLEDRVDLVRLDPAVRHVFPDGTAVSLPSGSRAGVLAALDEALGAGAGERWTGMLARARTVWEATRRPLLEEPLTYEGVPLLRRTLARDPYPAPRTEAPALRAGGLLRGRARPLAEVAAGELRDPRLVSMLTSCAHAYGLDPGSAPAGAAVLAYLEHTFGGWYVRGGMRALAEALYTRCRERKVEFRFDCEVVDVLEKDGRAAGVKPAGEPEVPADTVVVGGRRVPGAAPATGPETERRESEGTRTAGPETAVPARSRLTVLLALRGGRPAGTAHRTVVHRADAPGQPLTVLRPDDPGLRPGDGYETAVLSVAVRPEEVRGEDGAARLADRLTAAADAAGLGLGGRVLWREVRTPRDVEAETGVPGGLVPAPVLAGRYRGGAGSGPGGTGGGLGSRLGALAGLRGGAVDVRTPNRTATAGLYRVGGWAHPGGGIAHAGMSGALVAGLVVEGDDWRGSA